MPSLPPLPSLPSFLSPAGAHSRRRPAAHARRSAHHRRGRSVEARVTLAVVATALLGTATIAAANGGNSSAAANASNAFEGLSLTLGNASHAATQLVVPTDELRSSGTAEQVLDLTNGAVTILKRFTVAPTTNASGVAVAIDACSQRWSQHDGEYTCEGSERRVVNDTPLGTSVPTSIDETLVPDETVHYRLKLTAPHPVDVPSLTLSFDRR